MLTGLLVGVASGAEDESYIMVELEPELLDRSLVKRQAQYAEPVPRGQPGVEYITQAQAQQQQQQVSPARPNFVRKYYLYIVPFKQKGSRGNWYLS